MIYKRPESILVAIFSIKTGRVLMLQRIDDAEFWQSVTGSLEESESTREAAIREVLEETNIDIIKECLKLIDCKRKVEFEIFEYLRYRYAPGVIHNQEHWYILALPEERAIQLSEHQNYQWLEPHQAVLLTKSWSNQQIISEFVIKEGCKNTRI